MIFKNEALFDLIVPTSMGVRFTPADRQPVHTSHSYSVQATSAESNVVTIAASLGMRTKVLTRFVSDSPLATFIKHELKSRGIAYEGKEIPQGGPWGYRHHFNIADRGYGVRGPRVLNDRAGEVGLTISISDFDLDRIFGTEGVRSLHLSGIIAALSPETGQLCLTLARAAREYGTRVSFDFNHRASFWQGREDELRGVFSDIAALSDILIGNEEDYQLCLGIQGPQTGGVDIESKTDSFKSMIERVKQSYPNATLFATTLRQVVSANEHLWGAMLLDGDSWYIAQPRSIPILDRIGGGDAFAGGLLYGLLKGMSAEDALHFGWATGALATTMLEDYAQPENEGQVWSIWEGNARVKR